MGARVPPFVSRASHAALVYRGRAGSLRPRKATTYTLPRRVGAREAARLTAACLPVSPASALRSGLIDRVIAADAADYRAQVTALAGQPRPRSNGRWPPTEPPNWPS